MVRDSAVAQHANPRGTNHRTSAQSERACPPWSLLRFPAGRIPRAELDCLGGELSDRSCPNSPVSVRVATHTAILERDYFPALPRLWLAARALESPPFGLARRGPYRAASE